MTDLDAACYLKEMQEYNRQGLMLTPANNQYDTFFDCAMSHAVRALEERAGLSCVTYEKNPNGSFSVKNRGGTP